MTYATLGQLAPAPLETLQVLQHQNLFRVPVDNGVRIDVNDLPDASCYASRNFRLEDRENPIRKLAPHVRAGWVAPESFEYLKQLNELELGFKDESSLTASQWQGFKSVFASSILRKTPKASHIDLYLSLVRVLSEGLLTNEGQLKPEWGTLFFQGAEELTRRGEAGDSGIKTIVSVIDPVYFRTWQRGVLQLGGLLPIDGRSCYFPMLRDWQALVSAAALTGAATSLDLQLAAK